MTLRSLLFASVAALAACTGPRTTVATVQPAPQPQPLMLGVEVLLRDSLHVLRGKRVGLITNHTGRNRNGTPTIDLLHKAAGVQLVALFSPEHGIRGTAAAGESVSSSIDQATGLPVHSLYGTTRFPTDSMLKGIDVLVYDIQDVGARVYTYVWTMALSAEAAGRRGIPFVVLDRPNPLRGDRVEGGVLDTAFRSFVGQYPTALRYGLTPGELLRWLVGTGQVKVNATVIPMRGWRRSMWWDETGLPWINPSPNLRSLDAAILYPGTVFFEGTNLSEGRGTDKPFQLVGAPWLDALDVAARLNARGLPGVRFAATTRTIEAGQKHAGATIPMIEVTIVDRNALRPVAVGAYMLQEIYARHGRNSGEFEWRASLERLFGSRRLREAVEKGTVAELLPVLEEESRRFQADSRRYWLYD